MNSEVFSFNNIVEAAYNLPLEDRLELKNLLEHNIADTRREEIHQNYKAAQSEEKLGNLKFDSSIKNLKKML